MSYEEIYNLLEDKAMSLNEDSAGFWLVTWSDGTEFDVTFGRTLEEACKKYKEILNERG